MYDIDMHAHMQAHICTRAGRDKFLSEVNKGKRVQYFYLKGREYNIFILCDRNKNSGRSGHQKHKAALMT